MSARFGGDARRRVHRRVIDSTRSPVRKSGASRRSSALSPSRFSPAKLFDSVLKKQFQTAALGKTFETAISNRATVHRFQASRRESKQHLQHFAAFRSQVRALVKHALTPSSGASRVKIARVKALNKILNLEGADALTQDNLPKGGALVELADRVLDNFVARSTVSLSLPASITENLDALAKQLDYKGIPAGLDLDAKPLDVREIPALMKRPGLQQLLQDSPVSEQNTCIDAMFDDLFMKAKLGSADRAQSLKVLRRAMRVIDLFESSSAGLLNDGVDSNESAALVLFLRSTIVEKKRGEAPATVSARIAQRSVMDYVDMYLDLRGRVHEELKSSSGFRQKVGSVIGKDDIDMQAATVKNYEVGLRDYRSSTDAYAITLKRSQIQDTVMESRIEMHPSAIYAVLRSGTETAAQLCGPGGLDQKTQDTLIDHLKDQIIAESGELPDTEDLSGVVDVIQTLSDRLTEILRKKEAILTGVKSDATKMKGYRDFGSMEVDGGVLLVDRGQVMRGDRDCPVVFMPTDPAHFDKSPFSAECLVQIQAHIGSPSPLKGVSILFKGDDGALIEGTIESIESVEPRNKSEGKTFQVKVNTGSSIHTLSSPLSGSGYKEPLFCLSDLMKSSGGEDSLPDLVQKTRLKRWMDQDIVKHRLDPSQVDVFVHDMRQQLTAFFDTSLGDLLKMEHFVGSPQYQSVPVSDLGTDFSPSRNPHHKIRLSGMGEGYGGWTLHAVKQENDGDPKTFVFLQGYSGDISHSERIEVTFAADGTVSSFREFYSTDAGLKACDLDPVPADHEIGLERMDVDRSSALEILLSKPDSWNHQFVTLDCAEAKSNPISVALDSIGEVDTAATSDDDASAAEDVSGPGQKFLFLPAAFCLDDSKEGYTPDKLGAVFASKRIVQAFQEKVCDPLLADGTFNQLSDYCSGEALRDLSMSLICMVGQDPNWISTGDKSDKKKELLRQAYHIVRSGEEVTTGQVMDDAEEHGGISVYGMHAFQEGLAALVRQPGLEDLRDAVIRDVFSDGKGVDVFQEAVQSLDLWNVPVRDVAGRPPAWISDTNTAYFRLFGIDISVTKSELSEGGQSISVYTINVGDLSSDPSESRLNKKKQDLIKFDQQLVSVMSIVQARGEADGILVARSGRVNGLDGSICENSVVRATESDQLVYSLRAGHAYNRIPGESGRLEKVEFGEDDSFGDDPTAYTLTLDQEIARIRGAVSNRFKGSVTEAEKKRVLAKDASLKGKDVEIQKAVFQDRQRKAVSMFTLLEARFSKSEPHALDFLIYLSRHDRYRGDFSALLESIDAAVNDQDRKLIESFPGARLQCLSVLRAIAAHRGSTELSADMRVLLNKAHKISLRFDHRRRSDRKDELRRFRNDLKTQVADKERYFRRRVDGALSRVEKAALKDYRFQYLRKVHSHAMSSLDSVIHKMNRKTAFNVGTRVLTESEMLSGDVRDVLHELRFPLAGISMLSGPSKLSDKTVRQLSTGALVVDRGGDGDSIPVFLLRGYTLAGEARQELSLHPSLLNEAGIASAREALDASDISDRDRRSLATELSSIERQLAQSELQSVPIFMLKQYRAKVGRGLYPRQALRLNPRFLTKEGIVLAFAQLDELPVDAAIKDELRAHLTAIQADLQYSPFEQAVLDSHSNLEFEEGAQEMRLACNMDGQRVTFTYKVDSEEGPKLFLSVGGSTIPYDDSLMESSYKAEDTQLFHSMSRLFRAKMASKELLKAEGGALPNLLALQDEVRFLLPESERAFYLSATLKGSPGKVVFPDWSESASVPLSYLQKHEDAIMKVEFSTTTATSVAVAKLQVANFDLEARVMKVRQTLQWISSNPGRIDQFKAAVVGLPQEAKRAVFRTIWECAEREAKLFAELADQQKVHAMLRSVVPELCEDVQCLDALLKEASQHLGTRVQVVPIDSGTGRGQVILSLPGGCSELTLPVFRGQKMKKTELFGFRVGDAVVKNTLPFGSVSGSRGKEVDDSVPLRGVWTRFFSEMGGERADSVHSLRNGMVRYMSPAQQRDRLLQAMGDSKLKRLRWDAEGALVRGGVGSPPTFNAEEIDAVLAPQEQTGVLADAGALASSTHAVLTDSNSHLLYARLNQAGILNASGQLCLASDVEIDSAVDNLDLGVFKFTFEHFQGANPQIDAAKAQTIFGYLRGASVLDAHGYLLTPGLTREGVKAKLSQQAGFSTLSPQEVDYLLDRLMGTSGVRLGHLSSISLVELSPIPTDGFVSAADPKVTAVDSSKVASVLNSHLTELNAAKEVDDSVFMDMLQNLLSDLDNFDEIKAHIRAVVLQHLGTVECHTVTAIENDAAVREALKTVLKTLSQQKTAHDIQPVVESFVWPSVGEALEEDSVGTKLMLMSMDECLTLLRDGSSFRSQIDQLYVLSNSDSKLFSKWSDDACDAFLEFASSVQDSSQRNLPIMKKIRLLGWRIAQHRSFSDQHVVTTTRSTETLTTLAMKFGGGEDKEAFSDNIIFKQTSGGEITAEVYFEGRWLRSVPVEDVESFLPESALRALDSLKATRDDKADIATVSSFDAYKSRFGDKVSADEYMEAASRHVQKVLVQYNQSFDREADATSQPTTPKRKKGSKAQPLKPRGRAVKVSPQKVVPVPASADVESKRSGPRPVTHATAIQGASADGPASVFASLKKESVQALCLGLDQPGDHSAVYKALLCDIAENGLSESQFALMLRRLLEKSPDLGKGKAVVVAALKNLNAVFDLTDDASISRLRTFVSDEEIPEKAFVANVKGHRVNGRFKERAFTAGVMPTDVIHGCRTELQNLRAFSHLVRDCLAAY